MTWGQKANLNDNFIWTQRLGLSKASQLTNCGYRHFDDHGWAPHCLAHPGNLATLADRAVL